MKQEIQFHKIALEKLKYQYQLCEQKPNVTNFEGLRAVVDSLSKSMQVLSGMSENLQIKFLMENLERKTEKSHNQV